jgi:hypothetical protein
MIVVLVIAFVVVVLLAFGLKRASRDEAATTMDGLIAVVLLRLKVYRPDTFAKEKTLMFPRTRATRRRAFKSCVVYITFYQIVSTLPFILADVEFPDVYDTLMSAVSVVNFAINQDSIVSCSLDSEYDYVTKLVISTTFPMVCAVLLWVCSRVHVAYIKSASGGSGDGGESGSRGVGEERMGRDMKVLSNYKKAILVLSFLILPSGMSRCCMDMYTNWQCCMASFDILEFVMFSKLSNCSLTCRLMLFLFDYSFYYHFHDDAVFATWYSRGARSFRHDISDLLVS